MHSEKNKNTNGNHIIVWDLFVRIFHWTLLISFSAAYLTAEYGYDEIHTWLGYYITVLILARVVWGFIGSKYARFSSFIFPIKEYISYFIAIIKNNPKHHFGHNPMGALMVFGLLFFILATVTTGLIYLAWGEFEGPLWAMDLIIQDSVGEWSRFIHYLLPKVLLAFILLHVIGVVVACLQHRENIIASMWNGRKEIEKSCD